MGELIKIREISSKYDVSARTLRYYEDMGLLSSTRSSDYAYRLYDQEAVKRLEQILILRKLNICIKDIQRIFHAPGSDMVLDILEISIIRIQPFRAFSSGRDTLDNVMGTFQQWQEEHNHLVREMLYGAPDFLWFEEDGSAEWIWAVKEGVTQEDTAPYDLITFEGGLYASAMSVDGDDDIGGRIYEGIRKWLEESGFESGERPGHRTMGHMVNPTEEIRQALGYHQMEIFVPIKIRARHWRKEG